jgi:hypothetical protein
VPTRGPAAQPGGIVELRRADGGVDYERAAAQEPLKALLDDALRQQQRPR